MTHDLDDEEYRATRKLYCGDVGNDKDVISIGEYVRTKDGQIVKLENNEKFYEPSVDIGIGVMPAVNGIWIDIGDEVIREEDIKTIVTHEQFNLIMYIKE